MGGPGIELGTQHFSALNTSLKYECEKKTIWIYYKGIRLGKLAMKRVATAPISIKSIVNGFWGSPRLFEYLKKL